MKDFLLYNLFKTQTAFAQGSVRGNTDSSINLGDLNPFGKNSDLFSIFQAIIGLLYRISFPIAVAMIIWGAFLILTAGGKPDNVSKGRSAIMWAIIGLIIVILVKAIFVDPCSTNPNDIGRYTPNCGK